MDGKVDVNGGYASEKTLEGIAGLIDAKWDYLAVTYPTSTTETYTFKNGGSGGTDVSVFTITYTDATKNNISTVERTT